MNAVPISAGAAATNGQYPIMIFHRAELDVVVVHLQQTSNAQPASASYGAAGAQTSNLEIQGRTTSKERRKFFVGAMVYAKAGDDIVEAR